MIITEGLIRKLAKSIEHQNIFSACKEIPSLKLFKNTEELSKPQQIYLSYLFFYRNLNISIASKEVSEKVLEDPIYEDAYTYYKNNKKEESVNKKKKDKDIHLIFKRKRHKKRKS